MVQQSYLFCSVVLLDEYVILLVEDPAAVTCLSLIRMPSLSRVCVRNVSDISTAVAVVVVLIVVVAVFRGAIINRTYCTHKNLYIYLCLLSI